MRFLLLLAPAVLLVAHGLLAGRDPELLFGLNATRGWPAALRWAWLGLGLAAVVSPRLREMIAAAAGRVAAPFGRLPRPLRLALLGLAAFAVLLALRCRNFYLGDSFHLIHAIPRGLWVHWNEPLDILLHAAVHRPIAWLTGAATAEWSYALLSALAGVLYLPLPGRIAAELGLAGSARALFVGLMLTGGAMQLFFGYAESYTLCSLTLTAYLLLAARSLRRGTSVVPPGLMAGLAVCFHPLTLSLGPSLLVLAWLHPHGRPGRLLRSIKACAAFALPAVLLVLALVGPGGYSLSRLGQVDKPGGGDGKMLVPLWKTETRFEYKTLFSARHVLDVANQLVLTSPLGLPAVGLGLLAAWRRRRRLDQAALLLGSAAAGMMIFLCLWNPDLGAARDWDLFAPVAFPLTALGAYLLAAHLDERDRRTAAVLYPLCSALVTAPWIAGNAVPAMPPAGWRG
jgi:hypothetical protein